MSSEGRFSNRFSNQKIRRMALYAAGSVLLLLQYPLWFGSGGVFAVWQLKREIATQRTENTKLKERNAALDAEVNDLKQGSAAIEERARNELGMVKKGETFYQVVGDRPTKAPGSDAAPAAQKR